MKINQNQVHIWHSSFSPEQNNQIEDVHLLDEIEMARANRFHFDIHRNRFIHAHVLTRKILAYYLSIAAEDIVFAKTEHGKPFIQHPKSTLQFNISHAENEFICALHASNSVGVDIEMIKPNIDIALAQRYFTEDEYLVLKNADAHSLTSLFYTLWAAKEAVIKATGVGLVTSLRQFSINPYEEIQLVYFNNKTWRLIAIDQLPGFKSMLACDETVEEIVFCDFENNIPVIKKIQLRRS